MRVCVRACVRAFVRACVCVKRVRGCVGIRMRIIPDCTYSDKYDRIPITKLYCSPEQDRQWVLLVSPLLCRRITFVSETTNIKQQLFVKGGVKKVVLTLSTYDYCRQIYMVCKQSNVKL